MFNVSITSARYSALQARLKQTGVRVCVEQIWYDNGEKWLDVSVGNDSDRYSEKLASLVDSYSC